MPGTECKLPISIRGILLCSLLLVFTLVTAAQIRPARKKNAPPPPDKAAPVSAAEAARLEAVINTTAGTIRFEFLFDKAPEHVQQFVRLARSDYYNGSAFHRAISWGLIQGGDPLLKNSSTPRSKWGTGGLSTLADEFSDVKHDAGTVSAVRIPGRDDSGGAQFFICATDQHQLDGKFSAFGRVTEGMQIVQKISEAEVDAEKLLIDPVRIRSITIEPKKVEPFVNASVDQMRREVLLRTSMGDITVLLDPDLAPEHCRNFLKLVESRWYDHTSFHRVVPGFVIQAGLGSSRAGNAPHPADRWVRFLKGEFSQTRKHIRGTLSMARLDDPDSAMTSFFIVLAPAQNLDGKYTIFGKVVDGFEVLDRIEQVPREGDAPAERIELLEAVIKP